MAQAVHSPSTLPESRAGIPAGIRPSAVSAQDPASLSRFGDVPPAEFLSVTLEISDAPAVLDDELSVIETYLGTALDEFLSEFS
jgi:hypothetical protein